MARLGIWIVGTLLAAVSCGEPIVVSSTIYGSPPRTDAGGIERCGTPIPALGRRESKHVLSLLRDGENDPDQEVAHTVYRADINNDGLDEYVVTYMSNGSGGYTFVDEVYCLHSGKPHALHFNELVSSFLGTEGDLARWHLFLGDPFLVREGALVSMRFGHADPVAYVWEAGTLVRLPPSSDEFCQ